VKLPEVGADQEPRALNLSHHRADRYAAFPTGAVDKLGRCAAESRCEGVRIGQYRASTWAWLQIEALQMFDRAVTREEIASTLALLNRVFLYIDDSRATRWR
jgi:hypothetical protein